MFLTKIGEETKIGFRNTTSLVPHSYNVGNLLSTTPESKCVFIDAPISFNHTVGSLSECQSGVHIPGPDGSSPNPNSCIQETTVSFVYFCLH